MMEEACKDRRKVTRRRRHQSWVEVIATMLLLMMYFLGIFLASIKWVAVIIPPYAWYLVVEMVAKSYGL
jgi:predicted membrane protein